MRRRDFINLLGGAAAAWPFAAGAQSSAKPFRIGLPSLINPRSAPQYVAFDARMRELGYVDGETIDVDFRYLSGDVERFPGVMAEFAKRPVDLIMAIGQEVSLIAAERATRTIPIVMVAIDYDPLALGHIQSLARPGGNITGVFFRQIEAGIKRFHLFREMVPGMQRAVVFWDDISADTANAIIVEAERLNLPIQSAKFSHPPYDYGRALADADGAKGDALFVTSSPIFFHDRVQIAELALQRMLPSTFDFRQFPESGGLMSYAPSLARMFVLAAGYVDRIIKGADPATLPVQQPTAYELVINLKTARTLGLTISPSLLARADEVIE